jgi:prepilin-type N-terminal cleavage/methylation domain-containing protein
VNRHRTNPTRPSAFTLLELIAVMVILAILLMAVAPSLNTFGIARQTEQSAAQIIALAQWARDQAISEGRAYRLYFNPGSQSYQVRVQDGAVYVPYGVTGSGTSSAGAGFVETGTDFGREFTLPEGVKLTVTSPTEGGMNYIEFRPSGRTDPVNVRIEDGSGRVIVLASQSAAEPLRAVDPNQQESRR